MKIQPLVSRYSAFDRTFDRVAREMAANTPEARAEKAAWLWAERRRERAERERLAAQRERAAAYRMRRAAWTAGVGGIMTEARRREAARALPEQPYFTSDNPLDGTRLWDAS